MDIGALTSFLIIAREGHLTRAARARHLSQPAVSAQLARLEDELGTALFHRTPKGMELTEAGELFRSYAEQALLFLDDRPRHGRRATRFQRQVRQVNTEPEPPRRHRGCRWRRSDRYIER